MTARPPPLIGAAPEEADDWRGEFFKRCRTRFCCDELLCSQLEAVLVCGDGGEDEEGLRRRLQRMLVMQSAHHGVNVSDLLVALGGNARANDDDFASRSSSSIRPAYPSFLSPPDAAMCFRDADAAPLTRESNLPLDEFIELEDMNAKEGLREKRRAVLRANVVTPKRFTLPPLRLSRSATDGDKVLPILRVHGMPPFVTTVNISQSMICNETSDMFDERPRRRRRWHAADEEAVEEVIFNTIREFGATSRVLQALAGAYNGLSSTLVLRICRESALNADQFLPYVGGRGASSLASLAVLLLLPPPVQGYEKLFCSYCLVFDCTLHGRGAFPVKRRALAPASGEETTTTTTSSGAGSHCYRLFPRDDAAAARLLTLLDPSTSASSAAAAGVTTMTTRPTAPDPLLVLRHSTLLPPPTPPSARLPSNGRNRIVSDWLLPCYHDGPCSASQPLCGCARKRRKCTEACACSCGGGHGVGTSSTSSSGCDNLNPGCRCSADADPLVHTACMVTPKLNAQGDEAGEDDDDDDEEEEGEYVLPMCPCVKAGRACDPNLCSCRCQCQLGQVVVAKPANNRLAVGMSALHQGGWGVFAKQDIVKDAFVGEYCGDLVDGAEVNHRMEQYNLRDMFYLFGMGRAEDGERYDLDAFRRGSLVIKLINDSASPRTANCFPRVVHTSDGRPHICIFALKPIARGQELCFDYGPKARYVAAPTTSNQQHGDSDEDEEEANRLPYERKQRWPRS